MAYDVTLLTESRYLHPTNIDWYIQQVLTEDRIVAEALERQGLRVRRCAWSDPRVDWSESRLCLFRTTWDYFHRFAEFSTWLQKVSSVTSLLNSPELIHWNVDKHYLQDLAKKGVCIVPSSFRSRGNQNNLSSWIQEMGGEEWVIKPTVSGAARHTYRFNSAGTGDLENIYKELIQAEDLMLQPFQNSIPTEGELSLMVMNGRFTHAVRKLAKPGDFRVQDDFGGSVHRHRASPDEIAFAENAVKACTPQPVYARVDVLIDNDGQLALGELELIEPELWFREFPEAADVLAEAIASLIKG